MDVLNRSRIHVHVHVYQHLIVLEYHRLRGLSSSGTSKKLQDLQKTLDLTLKPLSHNEPYHFNKNNINIILNLISKLILKDPEI